MKTKSCLFLFLLALATGSLFAQEKGFYGKNTFIEFAGQGQVPLFQNIFAEKGYVNKNGTLHKSYDLNDYGFRVALGTILSENFGLALEYNHRFYQFNPLRGGELNRQYMDGGGNLVAEYIRPEVSFFNVQERLILPKLVFSNGMGRIPAGLTQEFGVGYSLIKVMTDDVGVAYASDGTHTAESIREKLLDPSVDELKGLTYLYGIRMNYPVTKSFLLHVGIRYSYTTLLNKKGYRKQELSESWVSGREVWSRLNQRRQLGIITFGIGGTLCF